MTFNDVANVLNAMGYIRNKYTFPFHYYESKKRRTKEEKLLIQAFKILDGSIRKVTICLKLFVSFLMALDNKILGFPNDAVFLGKARLSYRNYLFGINKKETSIGRNPSENDNKKREMFSNNKNEIKLIKSFLSNLQDEDREFVLEEEKLILNAKPWIEPYLIKKIYNKFQTFRKNREKTQATKKQPIKLKIPKENTFVKSEIHCQNEKENYPIPQTSVSTHIQEEHKKRVKLQSMIKLKKENYNVEESLMTNFDRSSLTTSFPANSSKYTKYFSLKICFKKRKPEKIIYSLADDPDDIVRKYADKYGLNKKKQKKLRDFLIKNIEKNK
jgi:hypothetical protein